MAEYSRLAKGSVVSLGGATPVVLPFIPDYVEVLNYTAMDTPASGGVTRVNWDAKMGQGAAVFDLFNATPALITNATTTGGISTFAAGYPQLGASLGIASITKASPAVVTTTGNHGLVTGNVVIMTGLYQSASTGMQQIAGLPFTVTVTGATTFTIPYNTNQSNFTALSGSPAGAVMRQVLYPYLYFPGVSFISAITTGATTTIDTTTNHNLVVGQEVAFRIPPEWGTVEMNTPTALGQPVYAYVTSVTDANTVVLDLNSSSFTAFNSNPSVAAALSGLSFPQMVAVGDKNTGALTNAFVPVTAGATGILGIGGAFQNNTSQGFIIGATVAGTAADVLYWRAFLNDYAP